MTTNIDTDYGLIRGRAAAAVQPTARLAWIAIVGLFIIAIAMRHIVAGNSDVSWLLIAGERWLDGQRLYSDILETNPPMAVLVYVPGILIGRVLGVSAEIVVDGLIFMSIALSLAITALVLRQSLLFAASQRWLIALIALAVLAILPVQVFGQREHIAVIALMPMLGVLALRMNGEKPTLWSVGIAGLGMGVALSFKPHFAIALLGCLGVAAWRLKSWRVFVAPENFIAASVIAVYAACIVLFFPEYFTAIAPFVRDVYTIGLPLSLMLEKPVVLLWGLALIGTALAKRDKPFDSASLLLLAASLGFGLVYFVQRKGWPYHSYPMMAFGLLALGCAVTNERGAVLSRGRLAIGAASLAVLFIASMNWFNHALDARPLQAAVARLGPHPTVLVISGNGGMAHPLIRAVGGTLASRQQDLLAASYDRYLQQIGSTDRQTQAVLDRYVAREREWLIADFRLYRPTVVLVDKLTDDWDSWTRASPELIELMKGYRLKETVMDVDIYVRRTD